MSSFAALAVARAAHGSDIDALLRLEAPDQESAHGSVRALDAFPGAGARAVEASTGDDPLPTAWCAYSFDPSMADADAPEARTPARATPRFGAAGSWRWQVLGGGGTGTDSISNAQVGAGVSWFVVDDFSIDVQGNVDYFNQSGPGAWGGDVELLFRWHFLARDTWSLYMDGGCGLMWTSRDVPPESASFNFTPQAGAGVTWEVAADTRLMIGARWFHVSNANTGSPNPSYNGVLFYAGVSFGF